MANLFTRKLLNKHFMSQLRQYSLSSALCSKSRICIDFTCRKSIFPKNVTTSMETQYVVLRHFSEKKNDEVKLSLFQRFKQMYKDYWYVLVPVHLVTSAAWFGGFYYLAKSGVDIPALLESWNVSESITKPLKDSSMGYLAISYGLYKIATPARYTVTLGGTTISINYLKKWGYIKPVNKHRLKEIYQEQKSNLIGKKENLMESVKETKDGLKMQKDDLLKDAKKQISKLKESSFKK